MNHIDTHDVEVAFDELIKELSKLKDLNNLVDAYKDNIDTLCKKTKGLSEQIQAFYNSAKEHESAVNILYNGYADKAKEISVELDKQCQKLYRTARRCTTFNILTFILSLFACAGVAFLIFCA